MVAIITINYNLSSETIPCVESILKSDYSEYKIFLVDNGSKADDYSTLLKAFSENTRVEICRIEQNCGYVGGVNYGIENAKAINPDYFMIMNNDTIIHFKAIDELVSAAQRHGNKAIVSGKVYYFDQPDVIQHTGVIFTNHKYLRTHYPGRNEKDVGQFDKEVERDSLDDVFWLVPSRIIEDVGHYCNYFFLYAEQGDFALRARRKGYKLIFTPNAKIWHKVSMTAGGGNRTSLAVCYWKGKSSVIFHYRNLRTFFFLVSIARQIGKDIVKFLIKSGYSRKMSIARLRGNWAGVKWLFNKKPDNGFNPYVSK
jgi:GT2 family glycosyltransferase